MIDVKNVTKIFNENTQKEFYAIKDISFQVQKNELCILSGVSGSGKSTLLSLIAGLYKPSNGEIIIDDTSISKLPLDFASRFRRENIGFIFQNFNLVPTLSAFENILLPTIVDKKNLHHRALELLEMFGLSEKKDILVKNLSGGEQQRVAISRALINSPKLILADEPSANLDKTLSLKLLDFFSQIQQNGTTIIISTHDELFLNWERVTSIKELHK